MCGRVSQYAETEPAAVSLQLAMTTSSFIHTHSSVDSDDRISILKILIP